LGYLINLISPLGLKMSQRVRAPDMAVSVAKAFDDQGYRVLDIRTRDGQIYQPEHFFRLMEGRER